MRKLLIFLCNRWFNGPENDEENKTQNYDLEHIFDRFGCEYYTNSRNELLN